MKRQKIIKTSRGREEDVCSFTSLPLKIMSNKINDQFYEMAQEWLEEDLKRVLKKTRQEPGLTIEKTAEVIKDAFGDDLPFLINQLK